MPFSGNDWSEESKHVTRLARLWHRARVLVGLEIARRDASRRAFVDRAIESDQCVVPTIEGRAVAYAVFNDGFCARGFVEMLCVQQDFRRRGIGTALMRHIAARCETPRLFTSTNQSNTPMQTLLSKLGFERSGIIENLDGGDPELVT